ncbi:MAG: bifunctional DNA-formamidopyrimidine glycosylase/DNA-(apurinic or apyrimidinic site) lyase [Candidatus Blackburnbacteria bacterium]|nr:bifunctional DNA-formamidopyrimidine glycosylase/DNA-(apurinic or apyrimidinic site) lyase [Candidatus Blackburnbacteria bacterium]
MPELPEVETIRLGLEKYLVGSPRGGALLGHKIKGVDVRLKKVVTGDTANVIGSHVKSVRRFGKALSIDLDNGWSITVHIKLTGQLVYRGQEVSKVGKVPEVSNVLTGGELPNKWTHVIFHLDRDGNLYYNDVRQFGWIKIIPTKDVESLPFIHELGPEPPVVNFDTPVYQSEKKVLTLGKFREIIKNKKTKIKPLLMDQKKIGGVGNIYANDALFLAGIDPGRRAGMLSGNEAMKLYRAIGTVLRRGLKYGGATEMNFVNALGQPGGYQEHFLVYGREGEKCRECGGIIKKIRLGGRGTYYCPRCQH